MRNYELSILLCAICKNPALAKNINNIIYASWSGWESNLDRPDKQPTLFTTTPCHRVNYYRLEVIVPQEQRVIQQMYLFQDMTIKIRLGAFHFTRLQTQYE